ncbi:MAG TPA: fibronectin type III-like domain-contianing protein, partial [Mucilaginibacter sp.]|nr:fibronectin type III-like domain-contianing protein [Mucilaginibacter sp.]
GGNALADVLAGIVNPSGKLPVTFYRNVNTLPPFDDFDIRKGRTYMYTHTRPQYPFGFGLSYTRFNIKPELAQPVDRGIYLSAKVRNTGTRDGAEIVQLYVSFAGDGSRSFPAKRLKAFKKVFLKQGEERKVEFKLKDEDLAFYDNTMNLKLFAGNYTFFWANSSADNRNSVKLTIPTARILKTGSLLSYGPLKIINPNLKAGDSLQVDVICRNQGDITGRAEVSVDGKSFTQPDVYVGPRREAMLHFNIPLAGAVPHVLQVYGQLPVTVVPVAGKKELLISQSTDSQLATVGQRVLLNYQLSNNAPQRKSFISDLRINGKTSATRTVDLTPGKAQTIAFSVSFNKPGIYRVALNGECRSIILVGAGVSRPFKVFKSGKGAFYQVDSTTFWGYASGSIGGTPVSNNYGERTANDRYGALYIKGSMVENSVATVHIHQQERTGNYAKVGLMIRNRIDQPGESAGYNIACVSSYYGGGGLFEWDSAQGGFLDSLRKINLGPFPDKWLRIERHQSQYDVWTSRDGSRWKLGGRFTIPGATKIQDAGVFITSDDPTRVCYVVFSDFTVISLTKPLQETDSNKKRPHERIFTTEPI